MAGLGRNDFIVLKNGRPQAIASFKAVQVPARRAASSGAKYQRASANVVATGAAPAAPPGPGLRGRLRRAEPDRRAGRHAKEAVAHFLREGVGEGDCLSIVATGRPRVVDGQDGGGGPRGPRCLPGRPRGPLRSGHLGPPHEQLRGGAGPAFWSRTRSSGSGCDDASSGRRGADAHDEAFHLRERRCDDDPGLNGPMVRSRATQVYREAGSAPQRPWAVVERALPIAGHNGEERRVLDVPRYRRASSTSPELEDFESVLEASRRSNAASYFVDAPAGSSAGPTELLGGVGPAHLRARCRLPRPGAGPGDGGVRSRSRSRAAAFGSRTPTTSRPESKGVAIKVPDGLPPRLQARRVGRAAPTSSR